MWIQVAVFISNINNRYTTSASNIYIHGEMVHFVESDTAIKISGKVDKSNTFNRFSRNILFFIYWRKKFLQKRFFRE